MGASDWVTDRSQPSPLPGGGASTRLGPLGILGGGQLARMTIQAAADLGLDVVVAERFPDSPATRLTDSSIVFSPDWDDPQALAELARRAPIVTLENEFVDARVLRQLETLGSRVVPSPGCVAVAQDKLLQKQALASAGLPMPAFRPVADPTDLDRLGRDLGWPLMLKARRNGYDGYGNALVPDVDSGIRACRALGWPDRELYAEAFVPFERELAAIVVRGHDGRTISYPVVESQQDPQRHICRTVLAPAPIAPGLALEAGDIARSAVEAIRGVGTFGVELFLLEDRSILVNELAPRPHNSGHYTIEACATSQFANHIRAVLGLPLGEPTMRSTVATMVNLLGSEGPARFDLPAALGISDVYVHLYGKRESRPGRKMGHVTAVGSNLEEVVARASRAAALLGM